MSDDERSTDGSDDGASLVDFVVEDSPEDVVMEENDDDDVQAVLEESKALTENLKSTLVNGRVLRDRSAIKKPEVYFDAENYSKVVEEADKKERLECLRKWAASGEYISSVVLTKKSSAEQVLDVYKAAKEALDLPDSDEETESADEDEEDDDEEEEEEEDDDDDDDDDDEDEDENEYEDASEENS